LAVGKSQDYLTQTVVAIVLSFLTLALTALGLREIYVSIAKGRQVKGEVSRLLAFVPDPGTGGGKVKEKSRNVEEPTDA